ncbi:MAG: BirA family biotin operon repressor/biotin-[acetyl-CoA-carboxylase] ligase [Candidatus Azotimanducaceae bacterium]|jgi:BirA family biotin operon repressor/biotin-[acetyl-CoA-carboxylase] ligase
MIESELNEQIRRLAAGESVPTAPKLLDRLALWGLVADMQDDKVRLAKPLQLLDKASIMDGLNSPVFDAVTDLMVHWSIGSTNTYMLEQAVMPMFHGRVCLAERQDAGKGRRGKHWVSPFGKNIYMSIGWRFGMTAAALGGLSLVAGMAVVKTLRAQGVQNIGLKWPNDVLSDLGKMAGILVEILPVKGEMHVVLGIGINLSLSETDAQSIDQAWSVVPAALGLSRNQVCTALLNNLIPDLVRFGEVGFQPFAAQWSAINYYAGQDLLVKLGDQIVAGVDRGIDEQGQLLLDTPAGLRCFNAGEVSLRRAN